MQSTATAMLYAAHTQKRSPLLFEKLKYQFQTFHTHAHTTHIHNTAATNPSKCNEFRESRHSDTTAFVWRVFLVSTAVARPYEIVPESSKFQLERHNLPKKKKCLFVFYFYFVSFSSFSRLHCSTHCVSPVPRMHFSTRRCIISNMKNIRS